VPRVDDARALTGRRTLRGGRVSAQTPAHEVLRVLLVEDSESDAELILETLRRTPFDVRAQIVTSRAEFTAQIATADFDAVLAAFQLPGWTGLDVLAQVRASGRDLPFILVTGILGEEQAGECIRLGAADYVLKNNLARLPIAVRRALDDRRMRVARAAAELRLRESENRFRKLIEASFDGICISAEETVVDANLGFANMFGYTMAEIIGRPLIELVAPESQEAMRRRVTDAEEGTFELVGLRKNGEKIILEATAKSHAINGKPGRISALRDVTQKRLLEEQFRQGQKMEAVGRLAGGVAHDFNNLLTVILSFAELLLRGLAPTDPRRQELGEIVKAGDAASTLTRQLLEFSRQQVIQPHLLIVEDVVADASNMLNRIIGEDIELVTALSTSPSVVMMDPGQLEQVIMNLAVNARDAMPTGGKLTIETAPIELDESYARAHWPVAPGRYAMLAISDNGVGMDAETRSRIFEPFFTTKEVGKGTGLGLATIYGIVKQNQGFVWAYSEPGKGSTFKIYIPLSGRPAPAAEARLDLTDVPHGSETVLLAEDAEAVRAAARQILETHGYTVLEAPNGTVAQDIAAQWPGTIHLLLTDVVMPEVSGRQLAEEFLRLRPDSRVLYMSGYTDDAVVRHGVLESGIAYLQKPFSPRGLGRKVREVLDHDYASVG
jgi:two-component system, cell cycle sensor histidine kinase and response regulator CckA